MKKLLLSLSFLAGLQASAQVVFQENFDGNGQGVGAWTILDVDGLTNANQPAQLGVIGSWNIVDTTVEFEMTQGNALISTSYTDEASAVNDWAITPQIVLPENARLYYKCWAVDANYPDGYELRLSPNGGNAVSDFTVLLTSFDAATSSVNVNQEIELGAYAGQTVRLAWINNSTDQYLLALDDIIVTTEVLEFPTTYCIPSDGAAMEPITYFSFGEQNFTYPNTLNGASFYVAPTDEHTVGAIAGSTYSVICKGNTDGAYNNSFALLIDYNNDGDFTIDELSQIGIIVSSTGTDAVQAQANVTIPAGTADGNYRMRLVKMYISSTTFGTNPCPQGNWFGQVIDYTLQVNALSTGDFDRHSVAVYPNPAKSELFINGGAEGINQVAVYNMLGQQVLKANFAGAVENQLTVSSLAKGVYTMQITTATGKVIDQKFIKE